MTISRSLLAASLTAALGLAACGGSDNDTSPDSTPAPADSSTNVAGIQVVAPADAASTIADPPADLVILDVRTQEEFDEGHIDGAVMLDFYRDDFAEEVATLDPDVPYVLYCRSGNRSGQASAIMSNLGFTTVDDIDGGIVSWQAAGLPVVTD